MGMTRIEGWESRLSTVIEDARTDPYVLGKHDCFSVAMGAVRALTGVDLWSKFARRYSTKREALRLIAQHGPSFDTAADSYLGISSSSISLARRGDICKYFDSEAHLGVCTGAHVAVLKENGLLFVPLKDCLCCWRIG